MLPSVHPEIEETLLGSNGLIRKTEFVRVITQSLYSLGYCKSASLLEQESGIPLQSQAISTFQNLILEGKWDESIDSLKNLEIEDSKNLNSAALLILEQKYIHHLKKGNISEALKTLRNEISPLQTDKGKLHSMASCLICPDKIETLHSVVRKNSNSCVDFRHKILENLQGILSPSVMIPERRLEHLLEQCLKDQMNACTYHNSLDQTISLLNDHQCHRDQLPTQTVQVLISSLTQSMFVHDECILENHIFGQFRNSLQYHNVRSSVKHTMLVSMFAVFQYLYVNSFVKRTMLVSMFASQNSYVAACILPCFGVGFSRDTM